MGKEIAQKEPLWIKKRGPTDGMLPQEVEGSGAIIKVEELTTGGRVSISSSPAGRKVILND